VSLIVARFALTNLVFEVYKLNFTRYFNGIPVTSNASSFSAPPKRLPDKKEENDLHECVVAGDD
jgi:hypothetical protein